MERRSANSTTPRKKYTVDAFEGIPELQGADADTAIGQTNDAGDETIEEPLAGAGGLPEEDEDEMSNFESDSDEEAAEASDVNEGLLDDIISTVNRFDLIPKDRQNDGVRSVKQHHQRKMLDSERQWQTSVKWASDRTLPRRQQDAKGHGGFHHSFYQDDVAREKEAEEGWKWYLEDGGKETFSKRQVFQPITSEAAGEHLPPAGQQACRFVMGPVNDQKLFRLGVGESVPLTDAWNSDTALPTTYKRGFILNLGARVRCLEWAPNRRARGQYLALSVTPVTGSGIEPTEVPSASASTPQPTRESNIQIWQFKATSTGTKTIDTKETPSLKLVFCTTWGEIKALRWCQAPSKDTNRFGLLGVVSGDGGMRVLDVPRSADGGATQYLKVESVAFECSIPDTICTCLTWLSSTRIAAGCANGHVAIWDLPDALKDETLEVQPSVNRSMSTSYMLSIDSCYPSHPHMLISSSMAGHLTLTDITEPQSPTPAATAVSKRSKIAQPLLLWNDFVQSAFTVDDLYTVRAHPLRAWSNVVGVGKARGHGTALAGSPCHPYILLGTANGDVIATNPVPKVTDAKADVWQQTWFAHVWRRSTAEEVARARSEAGRDRESERNAAAKVGEHGLTRILEGFKTEKVPMGHGESSLANTKGDAMFHTVHEKQTAITALAWNPNIHVAGWAAAGMADGLVRVEDIAL